MIYFLIAILAIIVYAIFSSANTMKKTDERLLSEGINPRSLIDAGSYVGGHPMIDNQIKLCVIYPKNDELIISEQSNVLDYPQKKGTIPIKSIKNILLEDSTSIENKVTTGRILLVGIYAWGWKKKVKNELAFVTIEWNNGRFDNSTVFTFEDKDAMQTANKVRNQLLKLL